jgi:hypothetical protein
MENTKSDPMPKAKLSVWSKIDSFTKGLAAMRLFWSIEATIQIYPTNHLTTAEN